MEELSLSQSSTFELGPDPIPACSPLICMVNFFLSPELVGQFANMLNSHVKNKQTNKNKSPWFYNSSSSSPNTYFCVYCSYVITTLLLTPYSLQLGSLLLCGHSSCLVASDLLLSNGPFAVLILFTPQWHREDPFFLFKTVLSWSQGTIPFHCILFLFPWALWSLDLHSLPRESSRPCISPER